jgi:flagellar basal body-associated protein FliL
MYSSISNHDGVDYESKLHALKNSTSAYSLDDDGGNTTTIGVKRKFPKKLLVSVGVFLLAAGGAYAYLKFKNKSKTPQRRDPRMQKTPPAKPARGLAPPKQKKKPSWVKQVIALVVLGLVAGLVYGGYKLHQKRKTVTI